MALPQLTKTRVMIAWSAAGIDSHTPSGAVAEALGLPEGGNAAGSEGLKRGSSGPYLALKTFSYWAWYLVKTTWVMMRRFEFCWRAFSPASSACCQSESE